MDILLLLVYLAAIVGLALLVLGKVVDAIWWVFVDLLIEYHAGQQKSPDNDGAS